MEKKDILELFLKNGVMLSPEEFVEVNEKNYMHLLEKKLGGGKKDDFTIVKPKSGRISCEQFIKISGGKFEFLRDAILKKTEATSINKGKKVFSEVTIIGRVKEITGRGFTLEDVTGEAEVVSENRDIKPGDTLGVKGFFKENSFFPNQTIWPDIPLENNPEPVGIRITLTTKVKDEGMPGVIVCPETERKCNIITGFGRLGTVKISKGSSEMAITAYSAPGEIKEEDAVRILKKRLIPEDGVVDNLIDDIPNMFWLFNNKRNWTKNYRGVLIISTDSESFAEYDGEEVGFGKL
jgi:hypothetical protein